MNDDDTGVARLWSEIVSRARGQPQDTSTVMGECTCGPHWQPVAQSMQPVDRSFLTKPKKELSMFSEVARDVKSFLLEHRGVIYFIAIALIVDHLFFKDAFRHRLQAMADKMVQRVEDKIAA